MNQCPYCQHDIENMACEMCGWKAKRYTFTIPVRTVFIDNPEPGYDYMPYTADTHSTFNILGLQSGTMDLLLAEGWRVCRVINSGVSADGLPTHILRRKV